MKGHGCPQVPFLMRPTAYTTLTREGAAHEHLVLQHIDAIVS